MEIDAFSPAKDPVLTLAAWAPAFVAGYCFPQDLVGIFRASEQQGSSLRGQVGNSNLGTI